MFLQESENILNESLINIDIYGIEKCGRNILNYLNEVYYKHLKNFEIEGITYKSAEKFIDSKAKIQIQLKYFKKAIKEGNYFYICNEMVNQSRSLYNFVRCFGFLSLSPFIMIAITNKQSKQIKSISETERGKSAAKNFVNQYEKICKNFIEIFNIIIKHCEKNYKN